MNQIPLTDIRPEILYLQNLMIMVLIVLMNFKTCAFSKLYFVINACGHSSILAFSLQFYLGNQTLRSLINNVGI